VWQWTPFMFVILLAGLTSIPPNLYEASELDGIGGWLAFRLITLPLLAPMITLAITFRLLDAIRLFDTIFIMTAGGPGTKTYTSSFYLYTVGFTQFHLSQATAGSWILLVLTAALVSFLVRRLLKAEAV
jgi:multiple sugar transport system permease protein